MERVGTSEGVICTLESSETGEVVRSGEIDEGEYSTEVLTDEKVRDGEIAVLSFSADNFELEDSEEAFLEAFFLFRETSGSLMNTHSRPREVHLEHGYCRLHFTFDSAQAWHDFRRERLALASPHVRLCLVSKSLLVNSAWQVLQRWSLSLVCERR